jgi:uncharacterized membrane protein YvbJ
MKCRNCGAEIAEKALICYRCGTPTTEAKYQPAEIRSRRRSARFLWVVMVIVALALVAAYFLRLLG